MKTEEIHSIQPIEFFRHAMKQGVRVFRSMSICQCDDCLAYIPIGLMVTTESDCQRLHLEQQQGVRFGIKPFTPIIEKEVPKQAIVHQKLRKKNSITTEEIKTFAEKYYDK